LAQFPANVSTLQGTMPVLSFRITEKDMDWPCAALSTLHQRGRDGIDWEIPFFAASVHNLSGDRVGKLAFLDFSSLHLA